MEFAICDVPVQFADCRIDFNMMLTAIQPRCLSISTEFFFLRLSVAYFLTKCSCAEGKPAHQAWSRLFFLVSLWHIICCYLMIRRARLCACRCVVLTEIFCQTLSCVSVHDVSVRRRPFNEESAFFASELRLHLLIQDAVILNHVSHHKYLIKFAL